MFSIASLTHFLIVLPIGTFLIGAALLFVIMRYVGRLTGGTASLPVRGSLLAIEHLIEAAMTGNATMMKFALAEAVGVEWETGNKLQVLLGAALREVTRRLQDPKALTPMIDAIAKWTGLTSDQVFAFAKQKLSQPSAPPPAAPLTTVAAAIATPLATPMASPVANPVAAVVKAAVVALALTLALNSPATAEHLGADVVAPQQFYPTERGLVVDPPLAWNRSGYLVSLDSVSDKLPLSSQPCPSCFPGFPCGQPEENCDESRRVAYQYSQPVAFWQAGPVRRFVSAPFRAGPFRWLFRRRC